MPHCAPVARQFNHWEYSAARPRVSAARSPWATRHETLQDAACQPVPGARTPGPWWPMPASAVHTPRRSPRQLCV